MSAFKPSGGGSGGSVDLSPVLAAVNEKATQASLDAVAAAVAGLPTEVGGGALPGQVLPFAGALPEGFEQVGGQLPVVPSAVRSTRWPTPVSGQTRAAFAVAGGRLFVYSADSSSTAFREWDPSTGEWAPRTGQGFSSSTWASARIGALVGLQDGRVLWAGGGITNASTQAFAYTPATDSWASLANMPTAQRGANGLLLANGHVLLLAGTTMFSYNPSANAWTTRAAAPAELSVSVSAAGLVLLPSGNVLALTGAAFAVYNPVTDAWSAPGIAPFNGGVGPGLISTPNGALCLSNAASTASTWAPVYEYLEASGTWLPTAERTHLLGGGASNAYSPARYGDLVPLNTVVDVYVAGGYLPQGLVLGRKT